MRNWQKVFLERFGIVRNAIGKDLLFFFLPWLTVFYLELLFCENYGDGLSGIWGIIWELVKQPQNLFVLPWHRVIGLVLFVMGLTIMIVSQATLWRNYSGFLIIRKGHRLITHGIYRFTRHPIYLGALIVFIGLPVYAASLYGFLTMIFLIPIFLNRIRLEEQLLTEEFQGAYQKYKENTKKLIPFIY
jgi:protein-S-isoprenylcysteine O-methyltransferase Ste14